MADQRKVIQALTDEIKVHEADLVKIAGDVARANDAVNEAGVFQAQIDDVSRKRAEAKALAFVDGRKVDTAEFDRQEKELERLSRQAIEDSAAATIAIELLEKKSSSIQSAIGALVEKRKQLAIEWLVGRREEALDRYIKAISALCESAAVAIAADNLIDSLALRPGLSFFYGMLKELKEFDFPVPPHRHVEITGRPGARHSPARWNKFLNHRGPEHATLRAELGKLSVLSDTASDISAVQRGSHE